MKKLTYTLPLILVGLVFASLIGCRSTIDQQKFDPLNRAGKAIQASLESGVSYPRFIELLQAFSTEILVAKDKANSDLERELLQRYSEAFSIYSDSASLWKAFTNYSQQGCYSEHVAVNSMTEELVDKYRLITLTCEGDYGGLKRSISKDSFKYLWKRAEIPMQAAGRLYRGEALTELPTPTSDIGKQASSATPAPPPTEEPPTTPEARGKILVNASSNLCSTCHTVDGSKSVGPSFKGIWGRKEMLADGSEITVNDAYIRESIYKPAAKMVRGYPPVMPAMYEGRLSEQEVSDIIAYLKTLN